MKLLYVANARIPTEKAHGLQIMQNCEAFANNGAQVTLWAARRVNTAGLRAESDVWAYYGVKQNFTLRRVPCLDVQFLVGEKIALLRKGAFLIQTATFLAALCLWLLRADADIYYSRDLPVVFLFTLLKPRHKIAYEPHRLSGSGVGRWLQTTAAKRAGAVFPITATMAEVFIKRGVAPARVRTAHDGIRKQRFETLPDKHAAREVVGWPQDAFIVGYVGRLHTMSMDKGVGTLIQALARLDNVSLGLVGGPDDMAAALRQQWQTAGLPDERFLYAGQVKADAVPLYLSAFDVCAMPHPFTRHFATATSPLKLFEYMASKRPIVASDLPGWSDVIRDYESALLVPPGHSDALAEAIRKLKNDPELGNRLAGCAYQKVMQHYTWESRSQMILNHISQMQES